MTVNHPTHSARVTSGRSRDLASLRQTTAWHATSNTSEHERDDEQSRMDRLPHHRHRPQGPALDVPDARARAVVCPAHGPDPGRCPGADRAGGVNGANGPTPSSGPRGAPRHTRGRELARVQASGPSGAEGAARRACESETADAGPAPVPDPAPDGGGDGRAARARAGPRRAATATPSAPATGGDRVPRSRPGRGPPPGDPLLPRCVTSAGRPGCSSRRSSWPGGVRELARVDDAGWQCRALNQRWSPLLVP